MPLKVSIAPGEAVMVGKAKVTNGGQHRCTLQIDGEERVLRQKFLAAARDASTPEGAFYRSVLVNYVLGLSPDSGGDIAAAARALLAARPGAAPAVEAVTCHIVAGEEYEALVVAHALLEGEKR
jgi:flagellar biosynthesis regulator FlbT